MYRHSGVIKTNKEDVESLKTKKCSFCDETVGFNELSCPKWKYPLDRNIVLNENKKDEKLKNLR